MPPNGSQRAAWHPHPCARLPCNLTGRESPRATRMAETSSSRPDDFNCLAATLSTNCSSNWGCSRLLASRQHMGLGALERILCGGGGCGSLYCTFSVRVSFSSGMNLCTTGAQKTAEGLGGTARWYMIPCGSLSSGVSYGAFTSRGCQRDYIMRGLGLTSEMP